jgi:Helix-turn-helix domain
MIIIPEKYSGRAYASPAELAEILGIDRVTWYRHFYPAVRSGRIQSLKVGSALRVRLASFLAFAESQEAQHGT